MSGRVNPFADLAGVPAFTTKPRTEKPAQTEMIDRVARENNFPSRQAGKSLSGARRKPRVHRTGRNQHLGIKATAETMERFYKAADERNVPLGELLRLALDALDRAGESR